MDFDPSYITVSLDAISHNLSAVRRKAGVPVMAVIKADGYGHGAVPLARLLAPECAFFGVSSMLEALELRRAGIENPILILGYCPPAAFPQAVSQGIRPAIFRYEDACLLSQAAQAAGVEAPFHFAVDTGMSRIGFQVCREEADLCRKIAELPNLRPEGLFSHFATADCANLARSRRQAERFSEFDEMLKERGISIPIRHLNNSAGLMNFSDHYDMVRSGIVTYGLYPSAEVDPGLLPLEPAMAWYSRVTHVKTLPAGREISYGGTFVTERPTRVATVSVGYADGYRRSLSGRFYMLLHGKKAKILGRICMDQTMVDVTDIPETQVGDRVTLVGRDGEEVITMEQIAAAAGSFNYEFACGVSRRVTRDYLRQGRTVQTVRYLLEP